MKISLFSYAVILLVTSCPTNGENQDADAVSITDPLTEKWNDSDGMPFFFHPGDDSGDRMLQGATQVDVCDFHPETNVFNPLTTIADDSTPRTAFKFEGAKGIKFTFSTCGQTDKDTGLTIIGEHTVAYSNDNNCPGFKYPVEDEFSTGGGPDVLTFTPPDNGKYTLFVLGYEDDPFTTNVTWSTDKDWFSCTGTPSALPSTPPTSSPTSAPSSPPTVIPSAAASSSPSSSPSAVPSSSPSSSPTSAPSSPPTSIPSVAPSSSPSFSPSSAPSSPPSSPPTPIPSAAPSSLPSAAPSSPPTISFPSSSPSSRPTERQTCDKVDPCHYELDKDTFEIIETYFPVCIQDMKKGKLIYQQECYANSTIFGFGPNDIDPEHPDDEDRFIVSCGCCPTSVDEGLPEAIAHVKGVDKMNVCNGGIDCINVIGTEVVQSVGKKSVGKKSVGKKSVKVDVCIDGTDDESKDNFYIPADGESVTCGYCDGSNIIV